MKTNLCRPHLLGAHDLYKAHLAPYLQEAQSTLQTNIESTQSENRRLAETLQAQRAEMETLLSGLESVVADVNDAGALAVGTHLRDQIVEMDREVKASSSSNNIDQQQLHPSS